jgi:hypothetical protein
MAGLSIVSAQVAGAERVQQAVARDVVASVARSVLLRFGRARDGVDRFLVASPGDPGRLEGSQPWRWSKELAEVLESDRLEEWVARDGLNVRVTLARTEVADLYRLAVISTWRERAGSGWTTRRMERGRFVLADREP